MEELLRGYVYTEKGQASYYFENTIDNMASFIYDNAQTAKCVVIEGLFGNELLKVADSELTGSSRYLPKVTSTLESLKAGTINKTPVKYFDLRDTNNRDEFDSKEMYEKDFIRLYDGH